MKRIVSVLACAVFFTAASAQVSLENASGALESAYIEWASDGSDSYNVYYSGVGASNVKVDPPLVRKYGSKYSVDAVGLKAGDYTYDRAGFAFSDGHVPGAYKADGTLKNGAVVLYVTESTKNTVKLDVVTNSKGATTECIGLQNILTALKKGYETRPLAIRLIGNVTDPTDTDHGDIVIDMGKKEGMAVTLEGIGNDATANGWGIRIKNAQDVEVRNIGIMNVDSDEGDNISLQQDCKYIWVHNCDFFYGLAGSDKDQAKGDGALDCKKSTYVTFSYNHFWDNGKSNLLGLSEGTTDGLYITYHHNWYDHSDSRHPRVRYYSAHVYNNYYDGNAKYGAGSTLGSSVFMEANYFRNCKYPMMTSMQGSDVYAGGTKRDEKNNATFSKEAGGVIKAYNNFMEGSYTFISYGASKYVLKGAEVATGSIDTKKDFDAYVVSSRDAQVPPSVKSYEGENAYNNFDTDKSVMYSYTAESPEVARKNVIAYAGRVQGGDFKWTFDNSVDDAASDVNQKLKDALIAYKGSNGEVMEYPSSSSKVPGSSSSNVILSSSSEESSNNSSSSSEGSVGLAKMLSPSRNLFYDSRSSQLVIGSLNIVSLDIVGIDGRRVDVSGLKKVDGVRVLDMSSLRAGIYIVHLTTWLGSQTMKFVKN